MFNSTVSVHHLNKSDLRLKKDLEELSQNRLIANSSVQFEIYNGDGHRNDCTELLLTIIPTSGAYSNACLKFLITIPREYPFHAPKVKCLTRVLHPQINFRTGLMDLPLITTNKWKPTLTINLISLSIQLLFVEMDYATLLESIHTIPSSVINHETFQLIQSGSSFEFHSMIQHTISGGFFFGVHWERNYIEIDLLIHTTQSNYQQSNLPHITLLLVQYVTRKSSIQQEDVIINNNETINSTVTITPDETINTLTELIHPKLKRYSSELNDDDDGDAIETQYKRQRSEPLMYDADEYHSVTSIDEQDLSAIRLMTLVDNHQIIL